jgi:hypothetical protein
MWWPAVHPFYLDIDSCFVVPWRSPVQNAHSFFEPVRHHESALPRTLFAHDGTDSRSGYRLDDDDKERDLATASRREPIQALMDAVLRVFRRALLQHQAATDALGTAIRAANLRGVEDAAIDAYLFLVAAHRVLRRLESQLATIDAIRLESSLDARFGGQRIQRYFPRCPGDDGGAESSVGAPEASA